MWWRDLSVGFAIGNCLPGAMNLTKTADLDKCGYGIWLNTRSQLLSPHISLGKNVFIFGVGNSFSGQVDNKKKISQFFGKVLLKNKMILQ